MKNDELESAITNKRKMLALFKRPLFLLFPKDLEVEYMNYYYEKMKDPISFAIYLGLGLFLIFGILDFIVLEGKATNFWIIRFLMVLPATAITASWSRSPSFRKVFQEIQGALVLLGGTSIMVMIAIGSPFVQKVYYAGLILVVLYSLMILRIRFIISSILAIIIFIAYEYVAININNLSQAIIINNSFFLLSSILLGMFASYYNEWIIRKDFLYKRSLEAEKRAIAKENQSLELRAVEENKKLRKLSVELENKIKLQKDMMLTLEVSEQKYATLIDNMAEGVAVVDDNEDITLCNRAAEDIFGVEHGKLLFRSIRHFIHEKDIEQVLSNSIFEDKEKSKYDIRINRSDGEVRYLVVSATPFKNNKNQVMGTLAIFRDITERKLAEQEMEIFKNIIENSNYGSAILNEEGEFIYLNKYFADLHGYSQEELINQNSNLIAKPVIDEYELSSEENVEDLKLNEKSKSEQQFKNLLNGSYEPVEVLSKHKNGDVVPLLMNSILLKNREGNSNLTAIVGMDLSLQKENEKIAIKSLQEKELLLMEVHHRVKNNMQIISSMLNLQMKFASDEVSKAQFKICQTRVKSLSLIHEKLYRTKDFHQINFADYVKSLVAMLHQNYREDCGYIKFEYDMDDIYLNINMAIPCALIINELVTNSFKYAFPDKSSGNIKISLVVSEGEYNLIVSDDGIGIEGEIDLVDPPTLGLLLVKSLTTQLHGKLELDKNSGTTIKISFGEVDLKTYNRLGSAKKL